MSSTDAMAVTAGAGLGGRSGFRVRRDRPQWVRAAAWSLRPNLQLAAWFWAVCAVGVTVVTAVIAQVGEVRFSVAQFVSHALTWYPFSLMLIMSTVILTVHVANGMTRRSFVRGALVSAGVTAVLFGLLMTVALLVEGAVYDAQGWPHDAGIGESDVTTGPWHRGPLVSFVSYTLDTAVGALAGLLVGATYYRAGGWRGTLLLPVTLLPVLLVTGATTGRTGWHQWGTSLALPDALTLLAAAAVVLITAVVAARVVRTAAIARPTS